MFGFARRTNPVVDTEFRTVATGHQTGSRGTTNRRRRKRIDQVGTFSKDPIDVRRLELGSWRQTERRRCLVIGIDEEHIRTVDRACGTQPGGTG